MWNAPKMSKLHSVSMMRLALISWIHRHFRSSVQKSLVLSKNVGVIKGTGKVTTMNKGILQVYSFFGLKVVEKPPMSFSKLHVFKIYSLFLKFVYVFNILSFSQNFGLPSFCPVQVIELWFDGSLGSFVDPYVFICC